MTGFIRGLFRSKPKAEPAEPAADASQPQNPAKPGAYYLPPDEAKTYGNLDYMRSAKSIRRSFSKKKVGEDNESIRVVSAMEMQQLRENGAVPVQPQPQVIAKLKNDSGNGSTNGSAPKQPESNASSDRRRGDDSMDVFRNMARDLKKR